MNNFLKNTSENVKLSDNFTNDFIAWVVLIPHYHAVYGIKTTPTDFKICIQLWKCCQTINFAYNFSQAIGMRD